MTAEPERGWLALRRGWRERLGIKPQPFDDFGAALWAIENAAFKPHRRWFNGQQVPLERGQLVTSHAVMAEAFGWTVKRVRGFEERMRKTGNWALRRAPLYTVLTICDFDTISPAYALQGHTDGHSGGIVRAEVGHPREHEKHEKTIPTRESPPTGESPPNRKYASKGGTRLPPNWKPEGSLSAAAEAVSRDWSTSRMERELQKFRAFHEQRGTVSLNWQASFEAWVLKAPSFETKDEAEERATSAYYRTAADRMPMQRGVP